MNGDRIMRPSTQRLSALRGPARWLTGFTVSVMLCGGSPEGLASEYEYPYNPCDPLDKVPAESIKRTLDEHRMNHMLSPGSIEDKIHAAERWQNRFRRQRALVQVYSVEGIEGDIRELRARITQRDEALQSWEREADALRAELRTLRDANEASSKGLEDALQALDILKAENADLQLDRGSQTLRIAELEGHNAALKQENDRLLKRLEESTRR